MSAFISVLLSAVPLFAGVEDDWKDMFGQAQHAAAAKDYPKAEALYTKALHFAELFGKEDVRVASTLQAIGSTLRMQKKLSDAEDNIRHAVSIFSGNPGEQSIEYAQAQFDLAQVLMDQSKYELVLQSLQKVLPTFEQTLGPHDLITAGALCLQGDAFRDLKRYGSAEEPLTRCAHIREEDAGIATAEFGAAINSLALVYQNLARPKDADRYFKFAASIREQSLGMLSPEFAETLEAHALLLHQLGRDAEAKQKEKLAAQVRAHMGKN